MAERIEADIRTDKLPVHVAVIMDGNGRWAEQRHLPRIAGHKRGFDAFVQMVKNCSDMGIKYLTVYAFSTENWKRSAEEVQGLMGIMLSAMRVYIPMLNERNICAKVIGDMSYFTNDMKEAISTATGKTASNTGMTLCVALSYGGRNEIVNAVNRLLAEGKTHTTEAELAEKLYTAGVPDPDLIIRTSGEMRISNFLLWQSAYSEYYFTDVLWPDFDKSQLEKALQTYSKRQRRYGKRG